jgi:hypothetical protein
VRPKHSTKQPTLWTYGVIAVDNPDAEQGYLSLTPGPRSSPTVPGGFEPFETTYRTPWISADG